MITTIRPKTNKTPAIVQVLEPNQDQSLPMYVQKKHSPLRDALNQFGGVLIRGLRLSSCNELADINRTLYGNALQYLGGISPRANTNKRSFEASQVPQNMTIPQHREMGYLPQSPDRASFYCHQAATKGGETPITDFEAVFNDLTQQSPKELEKLLHEGLSFNITYWNRKFWKQQGVNIWGWQDSFHCHTQEEVTQIAHKLNTTVTHHPSHSTLHAQVPLATKHPHRDTWVMLPLLYLSRRTVPNYYQLDATQTYFFNLFLSECTDTDYEIFTQEGKPLYLGFIEQYHQAVLRNTVRFDWQVGDCLLLDNNWLGHGRTPFIGEREHWVSLANF